MDKKGEKEKQPEGCGGTRHTCPNMKTESETWDTETIACEVCGARYTLYDDEMR